MAQEGKTEAGLDFTQADLEAYLRAYDPRTMTTGSSDHVAAIPERDDLLIRWTKPLRSVFPGEVRYMQTHLDCYEDRLGALAARGIIVPAHTSFIVDHCPRLKHHTVYTAVKKVDTSSGVPAIGSDDIIALGHTLLDHYEGDIETGDPYIWDISKHRQYTMRGSSATLLDLDVFLTRDPRSPYHRMLYWANMGDGPTTNDLCQRISAALKRARQSYELDVNGSAARAVWTPRHTGWHRSPSKPAPDSAAPVPATRPPAKSTSVGDVLHAVSASAGTLQVAGELLNASAARSAAARDTLPEAGIGSADLTEAASTLIAAGEQATKALDHIRHTIGELTVYSTDAGGSI